MFNLTILGPLLRVLAQHGVFIQEADGRWYHTQKSEVLTQKPFRAWLNSMLVLRSFKELTS